MNKNSATIFLLAVLAVSCSRGVSHVQTLPLPRPNPTAWSFALPLNDLHTRALEAFSIDHQIKNPIFPKSSRIDSASAFFCEWATNAAFSEAIFRDPANTNDLYLHTFHTPFVLSSVYRGRGGCLPFLAAFHVHFAANGSNTVVSVIGSDTQIVNGRKFGFGSCGPGYGWNFQSVKPTTVEEYSLLRYFGRYLGVTNMPDVIEPTPIR